MSNSRLNFQRSGKRGAGFSLVELMISMALGLLIVGAAIGMFLSFSRTYTASESLSRVQENTRVAFELMARDLREAGGIPCSRWLPVNNIMNGAGTDWSNSWGNGVQGYENGALAGSLAGTDAILMMSGTSNNAVVTSHDPDAATLTVSPTSHGFVANDVLMICDYEMATIFQMTGPAANPVTDGTIMHAIGGSPGNCTKGLGNPRTCTAAGTRRLFPDNSSVVRLQSQRWYIAANGRGGNSLYRVALRGGSAATPEEVVEGVDDMELTYLLGGGTAYVNAASIPATRWREVSAVHLALTMAGKEKVGTDNSVVKRTLEFNVTLRSRNT